MARRVFSSSSRGLIRGRSRPPAAKEWGGAIGSTSAQGLGSVGFWILTPPAALNLDNPTLLLGRAAVSAINVGLIGAGGSAFGFGVIVASGDPDDVTVPNVIPDPVNDPEADWVFRWIANGVPGQPAGTISDNGGADTNIVSRARRKIPNGSGLLGVTEVDIGNTWSWHFDYRYLILTG